MPALARALVYACVALMCATLCLALVLSSDVLMLLVMAAGLVLFVTVLLALHDDVEHDSNGEGSEAPHADSNG